MLIRHIELATAAAVPAIRTAQIELSPGWLVPLDSGTVGRSHSAVPLAHEAADLAVVAEVERLFAGAGLSATWRLARLPAFAPLCEALVARGYTTSQPTWVQFAGLADAKAHLSAQAAVQVVFRVESEPFDDWRSVYLGPGFDAKDAASRIDILARGKRTQYAVAYVEGMAAAAGALSIYQPPQGTPLASVHGMRTAASYRRQGLASAILVEFAKRSTLAGCEQWFLQVEAGNASAQRLYAGFGFETAWVYDYWRLG